MTLSVICDGAFYAVNYLREKSSIIDVQQGPL